MSLSLHTVTLKIPCYIESKIQDLDWKKLCVYFYVHSSKNIILPFKVSLNNLQPCKLKSLKNIYIYITVNNFACLAGLKLALKSREWMGYDIG